MSDGGASPLGQLPAPAKGSFALVLEQVHAVDAAGPRGIARGRLAGVDLHLTRGVHAVLGAPEDGTIALTEALAGSRHPLRGRVLVAGKEPSRSAAVRARIGALGPVPRLPDARSVRHAVRLAMRARGEQGDRADAVLEALGLSALRARNPLALAFTEARAVELALALSTPAPQLVILHEPLAEVAIAQPGSVRQRISDLASAGVCVVVVTSSPADARLLADDIYVLQRGVILRATKGDGAGLMPGHDVVLVAWVRDGSPGVRELAAALAHRPEVHALAVDRPHDAPGGCAAVRLHGPDLDACAVALSEAAVATGAHIDAIATAPPSMLEVKAATDAMMLAIARSAAPRSYGSAAPRVAAPPPAPSPPAPVVSMGDQEGDR